MSPPPSLRFLNYSSNSHGKEHNTLTQTSLSALNTKSPWAVLTFLRMVWSQEIWLLDLRMCNLENSLKLAAPQYLFIGCIKLSGGVPAIMQTDITISKFFSEPVHHNLSVKWVAKTKFHEDEPPWAASFSSHCFFGWLCYVAKWHNECLYKTYPAMNLSMLAYPEIKSTKFSFQLF